MPRVKIDRADASNRESAIKNLFTYAIMRRVNGLFFFIFWQGPLHMLDTTLLILLGLAALGFISHNTTVAISILVLIIVRVIAPRGLPEALFKHGNKGGGRVIAQALRRLLYRLPADQHL